MNRFSNYRWTALLAVAMSLGGCKKKVVAPPPAPAPAVIILPKEEPKKPPNLPPAPRINTNPGTPDQPPVSVEIQAPPPPPPAKKKQRARASKKQETRPAPEVKPAETAVQPEPPSAQAPKLGQLLTEEQTKAYNRRLDAALERVKNALVIIQGKTLSGDQQETVSRIRGFLAQAEQARDQDLASSVNLADRADLLSRDLLERLR